MKKDFYKILGINRDASPKEINDAYKKLSKKYHPDLNANSPAASKKFAEISEAYNELIKPRHRNVNNKNNYDEYSYKEEWHNMYYDASSKWSNINTDYNDFMTDNLIFYFNIIMIIIATLFISFPSSLFTIIILCSLNNGLLLFLMYLYFIVRFINYRLCLSKILIIMLICIVISKVLKGKKMGIRYVFRSLNLIECITLLKISFYSVLISTFLSVFDI